MRKMSLAWVGSVVLMLSAACGADDKVLTPDGNTSGDGGGGTTGGSNGDANGASSGNSTGASSTQGGNDGDGGGGTSGGTPSDPECDMNGVWIGRQITQSDAVGAGQFANNWYYLEFRHDGDEVTVTKHFDCGIEVQSTLALVKIKPATAKALMLHNVQTGRKGTLKKGSGDVCDFEMETFWSVRGADESKYVPTPRNSTQTIAQVSSSNKLPDKNNTEGAEDWDGDGKLGVAWEVSKLATGTRNTVQRDWTRYFSDAEHPFPAGTNLTQDVTVRAEFSNEENILDPTSGPLAAGAKPNGTAAHTLTLRFLGRGLSDPRAQALIKADPFDTCLAIQAALPAQDGL